jgi:spore maturation protein CgeB
VAGLKVLVVGASPDALNRNAFARAFVATGLRSDPRVTEVHDTPIETAVQVLRNVEPDLTLVFGSLMPDGADLLPVAELGRRGGKVAFWLHDDPYEFDAGTRVYELADAVFTNDRSALVHYPPGLAAHHLPLGACPIQHRRPVVRRYEPHLFFCGHQFDNRRAFFSRVARAIPPRRLRLVGTGWDVAALPFALNSYVPNASLPDAYAEALAVAYIGRDLDLANRRFSIRPSTPGPRAFEAAMAGAAQIALAEGGEIAEAFEPGREILLVDSAEAAAEAFLMLLADPERSLALGRAAQARALAEHTYAARAAQLIERVL